MFETLQKEIAYAKTSTIPSQTLHKAYGRITMAHELGAISTDEYMKLSHECVTDGINNPKYFD